MPGTCGGGVISSNTKHQNPIVGIHVAAGGGEMLSCVVTKEMLRMLDTTVVTSQRMSGLMFLEHPVHLPVQTKLRKSPIADYVPTDSLPSNMKGDFGVDPVMIALSKYSKPIVREPSDFHCIVFLYQVKLSKHIGDSHAEILTQQQAISGYGSMDGIDMSTSPGLPYAKMGLTKRDLINETGVIHPLLSERLETLYSYMFSGVRANLPFMTVFKDELRPIEKVKGGKTRLIECCSLELVIAMRQLFGKFVSTLHESVGFGTGVAVGINDECDWHPLFVYAQHFGDEALCIDYSGFDASVQPFMLDSVIQLMCEMCGRGDAVSHFLKQVLGYSLHHMGRLSFYVEGCLPSGCPLTSILNSMINNMVIWWCLWKSSHFSVYGVFDHFRVICYGDDSVIMAGGGR